MKIELLELSRAHKTLTEDCDQTQLTNAVNAALGEHLKMDKNGINSVRKSKAKKNKDGMVKFSVDGKDNTKWSNNEGNWNAPLMFYHSNLVQLELEDVGIFLPLSQAPVAYKQWLEKFKLTDEIKFLLAQKAELIKQANAAADRARQEILQGQP